MPENQKNFTEFVMWGPRGSGKTMLVEGFKHRIGRINDILSKEDFILELKSDSNYNSINLSDPNHIQVEPTSQPRWEAYTFSRKGKKDDLAHNISSQCHKINLVDPPGGLMPGSDNPDPQRVNDFTLYEEQIRKATNLFLIIHPGETEITENIKNQSSPSNFQNIFIELLNIIQISTMHRRIVACIPKTDAIGDGVHGDPDVNALIKYWLGEEIGREIIKALVELEKGKGHEVFLTHCSAVGYLYDLRSEKLMNNIDPQDRKKIYRPDQWEPINVEQGFFWLFDLIERERIKKAAENNNGIFYSMFSRENLLRGKPSAKPRLEEYISYDEMMRHYKFLVDTKSQNRYDE